MDAKMRFPMIVATRLLALILDKLSLGCIIVAVPMRGGELHVVSNLSDPAMLEVLKSAETGVAGDLKRAT